MATVAFHTLGCKVNQYDTETMAAAFRRAGYRLVDFADRADVYVVNTCTVTGEGGRKSRQMVRRARRLNPEAVVVVAGCLPQTEPERVAAMPEVDLVLGTDDRRRVVELAELARERGLTINNVKDILQVEEFEDLPLEGFGDKTRAVVKIQEGCEEFCSYCIIPFARGPVRSRRPESVQAEVERLAAAGFPEIVLAGTHLGAYGRDLGAGPDLAAMLEIIHQVDGIRRIRLSSVEPMDVDEGLLSTMARLPRVCQHLHLPLQSGSDRVLAQMGRRYDRGKYLDLVGLARQLMPDLGLTTDIMVGFPGETDADFRDTCDAVRQARFSRTHIFPYSPRRGTRAARFSGQVPTATKKERCQELDEIAREYSRRFIAGYVGQVVEVLVESEGGGFTDNYIRVTFDAPDSLAGRLVPVRLTRVVGQGAAGELAVPVEAAPGSGLHGQG